MSFVHCNVKTCRVRPTSSKKKFFISSCTHIFCDSCGQKVATKESCLVCEVAKPKLIEINRNLPEELQLFFMDLEKVIEKSQDVVDSVLTFQEAQRDIHSKFLRSRMAQSKKLEVIARQSHEKTTSLMRQVEMSQEALNKQRQQMNIFVEKLKEAQSENALLRAGGDPQKAAAFMTPVSSNHRPPIPPPLHSSHKTLKASGVYLDQSMEDQTLPMGASASTYPEKPSTRLATRMQPQPKQTMTRSDEMLVHMTMESDVLAQVQSHDDTISPIEQRTPLVVKKLKELRFNEGSVISVPSASTTSTLKGTIAITAHKAKEINTGRTPSKTNTGEITVENAQPRPPETPIPQKNILQTETLTGRSGNIVLKTPTMPAGAAKGIIARNAKTAPVKSKKVRGGDVFVP